jgi:hypothetical protein
VNVVNGVNGGGTSAAGNGRATPTATGPSRTTGLPRPPRSPRAPLFRHPGRVAIVAIALILVLNLGIVLLATSDTTPGGQRALPNDVESISPERGQLTGPIDDVTVDLLDNLTGVLVIDGVEIPEDQLDRVPELGIVSFRPGPGKDITRFRAGDNTVSVLYWPRTKSRPANPPRFGWRFRAAA